ncbi:MAG: zinc ribbon domain-containing protein [Bacilli bacterium]|nr:zinc ribbon domain-containing protein [Bacilli bacterium]
MVCKNCGADLKPGIKYCLECGSYLEDDDEDEEFDDESGELSTDYKPITLREGSSRRKKRRLNLTLADYLIYAGLLIVMIGSIIVIIVAVVRNNQQAKNPNPVDVQAADKVLTIENFKVTVPGNLTSTVQDTTLYVSDNVNYTFSYQNTVDNFDAFVDDRTLLENDLANNKYEILSSGDKTVNSRLFLIYEIKVNNTKKILYLTKGNDKYTTMGIIEIMTKGNWEEALPVIDKINSTLEFKE